MRFLATGFVLFAVLNSPCRADRVLLTNGNAFDGVVTGLSESEVVIRLAFGEVRLPTSTVRSVEREDSNLAQYLRRRDQLDSELEAGADDWLELALWARTKGVHHGAAEAAVRAAELDPDLEGLAPLMRSVGRERDPVSGAWLPYDEAMQRRGLVRDGSEWVPEAVREARESQAAGLRAAQADDRRRDRLAEAIELLVLAELDRRSETAATAPPVAVRQEPGYLILTRAGHLPAPSRSTVGLSLEDILQHQPGSLLPYGHQRRLTGAVAPPQRRSRILQP